MAHILKKFSTKKNQLTWLAIGAVIFVIALLCALMILPPLEAAITVLILTAMITAIVYPKAALVLFVSYIPLEPFLLKFVPDSVYVYARYTPELLMYLLCASVVVRLWMHQKRKMHTPIDWAFVGLIAVALLSVFINVVPLVDGMLGIRQIVRFMLLFFIAVYMVPDKRFIRRLTILMGAIVLGESVLGIMQAA
ncbi:MAG: hypothetical protein AAB870_04335, partial [Patescibacteria group bacterium]